LAKELFDVVSHMRNRKGTAERSLLEIIGRYPDMNIKFSPKDWSTLFVLLRIRNLELSKFIDKFNADALMLRNISFALILFTITYVVEFFITGDWAFLLTSVISLTFCILAFSRSEDFRARFFKHIYRASLEYGLSIEEVINYNKNKTQRSKATDKGKKKL
jgi:hypothetical protein